MTAVSLSMQWLTHPFEHIALHHILLKLHLRWKSWLRSTWTVTFTLTPTLSMTLWLFNNLLTICNSHGQVSLGDDEQPRSKSGHGDVPSESMSTGWWFGTCFYFPFHIWAVILPIDELIFFKISYFSRWLLHHQPVKVCQSWVLNFRNVGLTMTKKLGWTIKHGCLTWVDQQIVEDVKTNVNVQTDMSVLMEIWDKHRYVF